jgi:DNA polymerase alpha subunit A
MSGTGRSRRAAPAPSRASNALEQLRDLKRTGKKQAIAYELKEEEAVYDVVDEDDYADIVAKRRREGGTSRFVVPRGDSSIMRGTL